MSTDTSEAQLKSWFGYLQSFKDCAEKIDTDVIALTLLDFANAKPTTYLPDPVDQNQFAVCAADATAIAMQVKDVCDAATFTALLGATFGAANHYIAAYLRFLSPLPFNAMTVGDFQLQKTKLVFPVGENDPTWKKMDTNLSGVIEVSCYGATLRQAAGKIVGDTTKLITDVVNRIAKLG